MLLDDLGKRIRARREKLGLKQHDIAHALQVSPQAVSKWERGENGPDLSLLGALAKLLGVSADWLLDTRSEGLDVFDATVFASSVTGAYERSLKMEPRDFASWANGFLYQITEAALRYDGIPVKYMGDQFLCFFSGAEHRLRAARAAMLAKRMVAERLEIGLSSGEIYLGTMGHPDYARPDIMGDVVNIAFLTLGWAEASSRSGVAATASVVEHLDDTFEIVQARTVNFKGIENPVTVSEIQAHTPQLIRP